MKDMLRNLEVKAMMVGAKVMQPLKNRKAIDEQSNSGVRGTVGLLVTLLVVALMVTMALLVVTYGNQAIEKLKEFFTNLFGQLGNVATPN